MYPTIYLARHAETAWSAIGQHTGLTDIPLTERGESNARRLGERLRGMTFDKVCTSPLRRAMRTCELAGFGSAAAIDADLVEWNYGKYEGRLTADILAERPGWELFRDGCPGGESPEQVAERAARIVKRIRGVTGNSKGHTQEQCSYSYRARRCRSHSATRRHLQEASENDQGRQVRRTSKRPAWRAVDTRRASEQRTGE